MHFYDKISSYVDFVNVFNIDFLKHVILFSHNRLVHKLSMQEVGSGGESMHKDIELAKGQKSKGSCKWSRLKMS